MAEALPDLEFYKAMLRGLTNAGNRGFVGGLLGAPVDMATGVINAGLMGAGALGNKMGLLSAAQMPEPIEKPVGGSEWIGQQMQDAGMVTDERNPVAETLAGLLGPGAISKGGKAVYAMEQNAAMPTPMNTASGRQAGAVNVGPWYRGQIGERAAKHPFDATALGAPSFADNPSVASLYATDPNAAGLYRHGQTVAGMADGGNVAKWDVKGKVLDVTKYQGGHGTNTGLTPKAVDSILKKLGVSDNELNLGQMYSGKWGKGKESFWDVAESDTPKSKRIMPAYLLFDDPAIQQAIREKGYSGVQFKGALSDANKRDPLKPWVEHTVHNELRVVDRDALF